MIPTDPLIAQLAVPVAATVIAVVLIRLMGGAGAGARAAAFGVPIGLIAGYAVLPGLPWTPPVEAADKLIWLALGGGLLGLLVDVSVHGRVIASILGFLWPAVAIAWLVGPAIFTADEATLYRYAEVAVVLGVITVRLNQIGASGFTGSAAAAVIAAGLGALAFVSGGSVATAIGFPLAAAGLGWLMCNWPAWRFPFGVAGLLGGTGTAMALAAHAALFTTTNSSLILIVLAAVLVEPLARAWVARNALAKAEAAQPLAFAVLVAIPAAIAVVLALFAPDIVPSIF
ncbi:MAG: hypothetical protein HQ481_13785 [Alphaproteobacteria bacterium]|nr:hypothetical protein [Alphaproteobacteria bacterium]